MKKIYIVTMLFSLFLGISACGKKGEPLPQKVDQLFSLQNVFATYNPEGTITIMGAIQGKMDSVQAFTVELEPIADDCISCPFVPAERHSRTPQEVWGNKRNKNFSITVMPANNSTVYRWRLVVHNAVSGLPPALTPVFKIHKPFTEERNFVEVK